MLTTNKKILIYLMFFVTLVISVILGENSSGGARLDYLLTQKYIESFQIDFKTGIELFKKDNQGHLPFFYIFIANLNSFLGERFVSYLYLIVSSCIPFVFYNVLKKNFSEKSYDTLFFLSLIIFLSPYFRSSTVWITTDNLALLFFLFSINSFLNTRYYQQNHLRNTFLCFFFLVLASYIRQSYALFFIFYFISIQSNLKLIENFYVLMFNFLLSIPALIWVFFIFKFEGVQTGYYWASDYLINILIFTSLFFFYFFPFILNKYSYSDLNKKFSQKKLLLLFLTLLAFLVLVFYDIPELSHGGGVFYKISKITNLNFIILFSLMGLVILFCLNDLVAKNYLIYLILIFSFPFIHVYQKYYDPLIFIVILSIIDSKFIKNLIKNNNINIYFVFIYFTLFLIGSNLYYI
tara:strand:+ start:829 stop:2049 length:1221 start_codon:yes stop_codon:yes gene_type:complete